MKNEKKSYIRFLGASLGAVFMFVLIVGITWIKTDCHASENQSDECTQIEFTSKIMEQDCFVCVAPVM